MIGADTAPDFFEPLEAWRVWRVVERDGELVLASVVKGTVWPVDEPLVARCLRPRSFLTWLRRRPPHHAPADLCECGIYATSLERAREYLKDTVPDALTRVLGRVALWGSVVECERGFRASHAYPLMLYVSGSASPDGSPTAAEIGDRLSRYGAQITVVADGGQGAPALADARS